MAQPSSRFLEGFLKSWGVILASEIGDKTFLIAAVMAMRNSRRQVFAGAIASLAVMTVLSAAMGWAAPNLVSPKYTHYAATALFFVFAARLLWESARGQSPGGDAELEAVERELRESSLSRNSGTPPGAVTPNGSTARSMESGVAGPLQEPSAAASALAAGSPRPQSLTQSLQHTHGPSGPAGSVLPPPPPGSKLRPRPAGQPGSPLRRAAVRVGQRLSALLPPVVLQAFTLTFLAEWGDRSQIATIGLAANSDVWGVTAGGVLGHALCTGAAVLGGKHLAERVDERVVGACGGVLFLLFGLHSLWTGPPQVQA